MAVINFMNLLVVIVGQGKVLRNLAIVSYHQATIRRITRNE
jgi:hypothetical protein